MHRFRVRRLLAVAALALLAAGVGVDAVAATTSGVHARAEEAAYPTPDAAVDALVSVVRASDFARMQRVLGPGSQRLIHSGDAVADAHARARFIAAYEQHATIELQGDDRATLVV